MKRMVPTSSPPSPASGGAERTPASRASSYFPGCRKDANCHCKMCLASINATLDLVNRTSSVGPTRAVVPVSPNIKSTAKSRPKAEGATKKKRSCRVLGYRLLGLVVGLWLFWAAVDSSFLAGFLTGFRPRLAPEVVTQFAEESRGVSGDLRVRLRFLQQRIEGACGEVSECSSMDSNWEFIQGSQIFFHWRCVIYQSAAEELSLWGSPLRTSGLLPPSLSPRWFTVLSGRLIEWPKEMTASTSRTGGNGSAWTVRQWSSAAVQLEADTWILEYRRSALSQGLRFWVSAAMEILRVRGMRIAREVKQDPWRLMMVPVFADLGFHQSSQESHFTAPT